MFGKVPCDSKTVRLATHLTVCDSKTVRLCEARARAFAEQGRESHAPASLCTSSAMHYLWYCVLLTLVFAPLANAQECNKLAAEIRQIHPAGFNEYPMLNDMKNGVLIMLYGRSGGECTSEVISFSRSAEDVIKSFDDAYRLTKSDNPEDSAEAFRISKQLKETAENDLRVKSKNLGATAEDIANSADLVVRDFLITQGESKSRGAELTNATRKKIYYYKDAALAYETAGESLQSANIVVKLKALEEEYRRDMEAADKLYSDAELEYSRAESQAEDISSRINAYISSKNALSHFQGALEYYKHHYEAEKIQETEDSISNVKKTMRALTYKLGLEFVVVAILLTAVSTFLLNRIMEWNSDAYDYYLGNELIRVSGSEI